MDHGTIVLLIPIVAIIISGMVKIARLRAQHRPLPDSGEVNAQMQALEQEVTSLRQELGEIQERLDFTERLLTQQQEAKRLDRGN